MIIDNLVDKDLLPTPSIKFQTIPSYERICRLTERKLRNIEKYTIFNKFGSIEF